MKNLGICVTHLYWPVKMPDRDKFLIFNLGMWDVGKLCSAKYDYILPVSLTFDATFNTPCLS